MFLLLSEWKSEKKDRKELKEILHLESERKKEKILFKLNEKKKESLKKDSFKELDGRKLWEERKKQNEYEMLLTFSENKHYVNVFNNLPPLNFILTLFTGVNQNQGVSTDRSFNLSTLDGPVLKA